MNPRAQNADPCSVSEIIRGRLPSTLPAARPMRAEFGVSVSVATPSVADLASCFRVELEALTGRVHLPADRVEAASIVLELAREAGGDRLLSWGQPELPLPGILEQLAGNGFAAIDEPLPAAGAERQRILATYDRIQFGLTGVQAGLADTGSLVLVNGPGRPRLASLLPPVHIALLPVGALFPTMASLFATRPQLLEQGSNLVVVTGPSRTADIELTLNIGVHGPRQLHVVLLPDV